MKKINALAILGLIVLGACGPRNLAPAPMAMPMDPAAAAAPVIDDNAAIAGRVLQQINTLRGNIGLSPLQPSPALEAASLVHSRDMSAQNRAWHWGRTDRRPWTGRADRASAERSSARTSRRPTRTRSRRWPHGCPRATPAT